VKRAVCLGSNARKAPFTAAPIARVFALCFSVSNSCSSVINSNMIFGLTKMFLVYPFSTFRQVQEDGELVQENPPGTNLVVLKSTPR